MHFLLFLLIALLPACGSDSATGPSAPEGGDSSLNPQASDRLDGKALFVYTDARIPDLDGKAVYVPQVTYWTFENGIFAYARELLDEHPDTGVPETQFVVHWWRGNYWTDECHERSCDYVFEATEGQYYSFVESQMVDIERDIFTVNMMFGEESVKMGSALFGRTSIGDLQGVRNGAYKK